MEPSSEGDDRNDVVSSQSLAEETIPTQRQQLTTTTTETLTSASTHIPPLPTLPFDLMAEILCWLPVKFLMQLRCICKSWNSLISDPKFAKKHLRMSTACHRHHFIVSSRNSSNELLLWDSPISSVFRDTSTSRVTQTQLMYPEALNNGYGARVCSCDGILLFAIDQRLPLLWNPSIRKFKILPPLECSRQRFPHTMYSFGYDNFSDSYKIFAIALCNKGNEVSVHTLGTDSWRRIKDFPYSGLICGPGVFVSGTVNWLAYDGASCSSRVIVSLDLQKESYQNLLKPDLEKDWWTLGLLRDCLCIFASSNAVLDVWVMKEYGNKESWTKLFCVPYMEGHGSYAYTKAVYISEDDQALLDFKESMEVKLVVYDSKKGTLKIPKIQNINHWMGQEVYIESLISPCS